MAERPLDCLRIVDLQARCIVGINEDERVNKQEVIINIDLEADLSEACASDEIGDTVDYKNIKKQVLAMVESSDCFLVEHLAEKIAAIALNEKRVERVTVQLEKPGALRFARSVGIKIVREA